MQIPRLNLDAIAEDIGQPVAGKQFNILCDRAARIISARSQISINCFIGLVSPAKGRPGARNPRHLGSSAVMSGTP